MHTAIVSTDEILSETRVRLDETESHHMRTVLRVHVGDDVRLLDGRGHRRIAAVSEVGKSGVLCEPRCCVETLARPPVEITLFQCIAKPARMDWLLEKAVELGVSRIIPILSAHAVVRVDPGEKQERWQRIAEAALRQCACGWMTVIEAPLKWSDALAGMRSFPGKLLVGALMGDTQPAGEVLMQLRAQGFRGPVGWLIGPEGDFSSEELDAAVSTAHAVPVSFGTQVLRVETAAVFGVSATLAILG